MPTRITLLSNDLVAVTSLLPLPVTGLSSGVVAIAVGESSACAVLAAGGVQCWGLVATNIPNVSLVPVPVSGLSGIASLTLGDEHACAMTIAGGVECWGNNLYGQLGNGTTEQSATPVEVTGF